MSDVDTTGAQQTRIFILNPIHYHWSDIAVLVCAYVVHDSSYLHGQS